MREQKNLDDDSLRLQFIQEIESDISNNRRRLFVGLVPILTITSIFLIFRNLLSESEFSLFWKVYIVSVLTSGVLVVDSEFRMTRILKKQLAILKRIRCVTES